MKLNSDLQITWQCNKMEYRIEWKSTKINAGHNALIALNITPNDYVAYICKDTYHIIINNDKTNFFKTFESAYEWCCEQLLKFQESEVKYQEKMVKINQNVEEINTVLGIKPL